MPVRAYVPWWLCSRMLLITCGTLPLAMAQSYPSKPVRLIVSSPPGATSDALARPVAQQLTEALGRQIVLDNRAGAGGNIGAEIVARATPDGYTLFLAQSQTLAINPSLYKKLPYDALRDFAPVAMVGDVEFMIVANPGVPAQTVADLVKLAKAKPRQITYGSASSGSVGHLAAEMLSRMAGIELVHVPYKGAAPALTDLIAGQVNLMFTAGPTAMTQIKAGRVKVLATAGMQRSALLPQVPTIAESGFPGYSFSAWWGVVAPVKTPRPIVMRLNQEINKALATREIKERFGSQGADPVVMTPEAFEKFIRTDYAKWSKVVIESGARVE
jgi:tripartite-type tricarboxylate transporter receptor subunit TctC